MEYTTKLQLRKPQRGANADSLDINDLNYNFDKIDEAISISGVDPTPADFPPATAENVGEHRVDGEGRMWYNCKLKEAKPTEYGFETITYTEGLEADVPAEGYYHSTDTDKFFKDGTEIVVDRTQTELPTPSSSTVGIYYLVGTTLSLGTKTEYPEMYAWICSQIQYYINEEAYKPSSEMIEGIVYERLVKVKD